MDKKELSSMNKLLQGEHMAVEAFNTYIDKLQNANDKKVFEEVQNQHRDNMSTISNYIQDSGYKPNEKLGLKGTFSEAMVNMQIRDGSSRTKIINKAIEAETKGINMAEKSTRGNLDDSSRQIIGDILHQDRMSLDKIRTLN